MPCRQKKAKCDGNQPCSACARSQPNLCVFPPASKRVDATYLRSLEERIRDLSGSGGGDGTSSGASQAELPQQLLHHQHYPVKASPSDIAVDFSAALGPSILPSHTTIPQHIPNNQQKQQLPKVKQQQHDGSPGNGNCQQLPAFADIEDHQGLVTLVAASQGGSTAFRTFLNCSDMAAA